MSKRGTVEGHAVETGVVSDLTHEAEGVVRPGETGGKIVFVAGALPGERISFRRRSFHKSHDEAELVEILEASPQRVTPRCAHFGVCGGCALQHLDPAAQIEAKQKELAANLERIGNVTPAEWLPPLLGPHWNYRRRARLSSRFVTKKDRSLVGFREKQGKYVADVQRCEVLAEPVASLVGTLADLLTGMARRVEHPADRGGAVRRRTRAGVSRARSVARGRPRQRCASSSGRTACASCCSPAGSTPSCR